MANLKYSTANAKSPARAVKATDELGLIDQTQTEKEQQKGPTPAGNKTSESALQIKRKLAVTETAQFQRLYEHLQNTDDFQYLERANTDD